MTVPIGTIMAYGGSVHGTAGAELFNQGWLICDGEELERAEYEELYGVIGDFFGHGDGYSTFRLPDLRGRFVRGVDYGAGQDPDAGERQASGKGGSVGDNVGSVQEDAFQSHMHISRGRNDWEANKSAGDDYLVRFYGGQDVYWDQNDPNTYGAYGDHETRPKNIYVNWIIKAKDVKAKDV